jgi:hypothetical protein
MCHGIQGTDPGLLSGKLNSAQRAIILWDVAGVAQRQVEPGSEQDAVHRAMSHHDEYLAPVMRHEALQCRQRPLSDLGQVLATRIAVAFAVGVESPMLSGPALFNFRPGQS